MLDTKMVQSLLLRLVYVVPLVLAFSTNCGCGKSSIERTVVSGTVSYQGVPVEKGQIAFVPEASLPATIAGVIDGTYRIAPKGGVPVGVHKVKIQAFRTASTPSSELAIGGAGMQYLPPRYNTETELRVTIESSSKEVTQDFHLN